MTGKKDKSNWFGGGGGQRRCSKGAQTRERGFFRGSGEKDEECVESKGDGIKGREILLPPRDGYE